jgi:hypothetical protein
MEKQLMQKLFLTIQNLATLFFPMEKGERVPPIAQLEIDCGASRGTVQSALAYLQEKNAISLIRHGHVGTFVESIDKKILFGLLDKKGIVGVMPLPYSKRYEGLATGLYTSLRETGLDVSLAFMRGSENRLKGLRDGHYDFVVLSKMSAGEVVGESGAFRIACTFGRQTYVGNHILVTSPNASATKGKMKIGMDYTSNDQRILTEKYFAGQDVLYVPLIYSQILEAIKAGKIDAAIWNIDDIGLLSDTFTVQKLEKPVTDGTDTEASVLCRADDTITKTVFSTMLEKGKVIGRQQDVMNGMLLPEY